MLVGGLVHVKKQKCGKNGGGAAAHETRRAGWGGKNDNRQVTKNSHRSGSIGFTLRP